MSWLSKFWARFFTPRPTITVKHSHSSYTPDLSARGSFPEFQWFLDLMAYNGAVIEKRNHSAIIRYKGKQWTVISVGAGLSTDGGILVFDRNRTGSDYLHETVQSAAEQILCS